MSTKTKDDVTAADVAAVIRFIRERTPDPEWQVTLAGVALAELSFVYGYKRREAVSAFERAFARVRAWREKAGGALQ